MHAHGGGGFAINVRYPIVDIVVKRSDEASLLAFIGVAYVKCRATSTAMVW